MAAIAASQPLVPSVLDRLLDDDPEVRKEPARNHSQLLRYMKQSVRRDLENLLNTRRRCRSCPPGLKELERSLVNYGLPDFTGISVTTAEARAHMGQTLEEIIRTFEPRFKTITVRLMDNAESLDRTLRFRIDAMLFAEPAPEPVVFDSAMEPATGSFQVKGVAR